jgi:hypothetical protein
MVGTFEAESTYTPMGSVSSSLMIVSPLREPSAVTRVLRRDLPRTIQRGGSSSIVGSETEYGSI